MSIYDLPSPAPNPNAIAILRGPLDDHQPPGHSRLDLIVLDPSHV